MDNVTEIHFSKCKCPGGYDGDPYGFSQEHKMSWEFPGENFHFF